MEQKPLVGQGLLIIEASRSYSDTPHSVGLLWMTDVPVAQTSTCTTHNTHKWLTSIGSGGIRTRIPSKRAASGIGGKMISVYLIGMFGIEVTFHPVVQEPTVSLQLAWSWRHFAPRGSR